VNLQIIVSGTLGVAFGLIYAISGFSDSSKSAELSKNPRAKNLVWLLGGAAGVILGDWKILSPDPKPPDRLSLFAGYIIAAVATAIFCIVLIAILAALTVRARRNPDVRAKTLDLVLDYIHRGYAHFRARLKELDEAALEPAHASDVLSRAGEALAAIIALTARERAQPDSDQREHCITQILKAMEDTVKLFAAAGPQLKLKSNYMATINPAHLPASVQTLFTSNPPGGYASFLTLRRYRDGHRYDIALPVETANRLKHSLPGAPSSAAHHQARLLNAANLTFESEVSKVLRDQIKGFFKSVDYQSVLSVPLIWQSNVVGVANFDSNLIDLVDRGHDIVGQIGLALTPYSVLLGELIRLHEDESHAG
jgi:hypothetical protein